MSRTKEIELKQISTNFIPEGGFRAVLANHQCMDTDDVIEEILDRGALRLDATTLKMILGLTFETMISGTMRDGISRRLGDYFMLNLEVHGKFDAAGEQFDPAKHKLVLKLSPLKAFRRKFGAKDLQVYNRNAGPQVVISNLGSNSCTEPNTVAFGEDLILTGKNMTVLDGPNEEGLQDSLTIVYYTVYGRLSCMRTAEPSWVNADGTRMIIPWASTIGELIELNPKLAPAKSAPHAVMVVFRSRGGQESTRFQLHRGRAYFDTYRAKHPNIQLTSKSMRWGSY